MRRSVTQAESDRGLADLAALRATHAELMAEMRLTSASDIEKCETQKRRMRELNHLLDAVRARLGMPAMPRGNNGLLAELDARVRRLEQQRDVG